MLVIPVICHANKAVINSNWLPQLCNLVLDTVFSRHTVSCSLLSLPLLSVKATSVNRKTQCTNPKVIFTEYFAIHIIESLTTELFSWKIGVSCQQFLYGAWGPPRFGTEMPGRITLGPKSINKAVKSDQLTTWQAQKAVCMEKVTHCLTGWLAALNLLTTVMTNTWERNDISLIMKWKEKLFLNNVMRDSVIQISIRVMREILVRIWECECYNSLFLNSTLSLPPSFSLALPPPPPSNQHRAKHTAIMMYKGGFSPSRPLQTSIGLNIKQSWYIKGGVTDAILKRVNQNQLTITRQTTTEQILKDLRLRTLLQVLRDFSQEEHWETNQLAATFKHKLFVLIVLISLF